jgi:hypothetical protein
VQNFKVWILSLLLLFTVVATESALRHPTSCLLSEEGNQPRTGRHLARSFGCRLPPAIFCKTFGLADKPHVGAMESGLERDKFLLARIESNIAQ